MDQRRMTKNRRHGSRPIRLKAVAESNPVFWQHGLACMFAVKQSATYYATRGRDAVG